MATDADEDMLTYTLWWGNSSGNLSKTDITATSNSGQSVTLEKNGLSNDTRYWFKVVVTDRIDAATSSEVNEKTYCKGEYCSGVSYTYEKCTNCTNGRIKCEYCDFYGRALCGQVLISYDNCWNTMGDEDDKNVNVSCYTCKQVKNCDPSYAYIAWGRCSIHGNDNNYSRYYQFCSYECYSKWDRSFQYTCKVSTSEDCQRCADGFIECKLCNRNWISAYIHSLCVAYGFWSALLLHI